MLNTKNENIKHTPNSNYLFFDVKCCDGRSICEVGYVITDSYFNIEEKEVVLINPEKNFKLLKRNGKKDIHLAFEKNEYETYKNAETFTNAYPRLKEIFSRQNQIVVGYGNMDNTMLLLKNALKHNLDGFDYTYCEVSGILREFSKKMSKKGIGELAKNFDVDMSKLSINKSCDRAELTMLVVKEICNYLDMNLQKLMRICPHAIASVEKTGYMFNRDFENGSREIGNFMYNDNLTYFTAFLENVTPRNKIDCELSGKSISMSLNYEKFHFRQMVNLIQMFVDRNIRYVATATLADVFVSYENIEDESEILPCRRRKLVDTANENGESIKIMSLDSLLTILGITEGQLNAMPMPDRKTFIRKISIL